MNQESNSFEPSEEAPRYIVDALRSLGFGWEWPMGYRPVMADLNEIKGPQRLETFDTQCVNDETLEFLRYTPNITFLDLMSTKITDQGMQALRYVPLLEDLWIINTRIGDAGIKNLLQHRNLKRVSAQNSRVTIFGVRLLNSSIPGCSASIGQSTRRGRVVDVEGSSFRIATVYRITREFIWAFVPDDSNGEFAEFLKAPIGRSVEVMMGEDGEPNLIWQVLESKKPTNT